MAKSAHNAKSGTDGLCAWQVAKGVVWVQVRNLVHGRRLSQRKDGRLVAKGVGGGYLRTYEFDHSLKWAENLIARYRSSEASTHIGRAGRSPRCKAIAMATV